jgi:hypothetical protein
MKAAQNLRMSKEIFEAHAAKCSRCGMFDGKSQNLVHLCLTGTQLFKRILDAEDQQIRERIKK